jgi:hypothetical protein
MKRYFLFTTYFLTLPYRTAPYSTASHRTTAHTSLTAQLLFTFSHSNIQNDQNDPVPDGGCDWKFRVDEDGLTKPNVIS